MCTSLISFLELLVVTNSQMFGDLLLGYHFQMLIEAMNSNKSLIFYFTLQNRYQFVTLKARYMSA